MNLAKISQCVGCREFGDSDVHFSMDALVVRVIELDGFKGDGVKVGKHGGGTIGEKVGQDSLGV